jgi:hypothetical protein
MSYIERTVRRIFSTRDLTSQQNSSTFIAETLEPRVFLSVAPAYAGALSGKVLFTSGGHGYVWRDGSKSWGIMRTYINGMMEDMGNQDQLQSYADYALHAGATFVSMRPIGHQTNEVIVDNSDAYTAANGGFDKSGTWSDVTTGTYWSNHNGNDAVRYHFAFTTTGTEDATARFTPKIPSAGFYPVYAWYVGGSNRADDTTFRINYSGGSQEIKVTQSKVGNGWVYLGNYYFAAGVSQASGSVQVVNKSATTGKIVIADAIRFGNGMGDMTQSYTYPNGTSKPYVVKQYFNSSNVLTKSGRPREDECALYWCYSMLGYKDPGLINDPWHVYAGNTADDETKNFSACDNYAAYMNKETVGSMTDRLWISFHTNAAGNGGTLGLITGQATQNQAWLANTAGTTVQNEMSALNSEHEHNWVMNANPTYTGGYGEISTSYIGTEFDATIIEVAYHDEVNDSDLLKDPKVRSEVGRATYHTAIKYFDQWDAAFSNTTYLPEPPQNMRVTTSPKNATLTVLWDTPRNSNGTTGPYGNVATSYRVWTSTNGYGFDLAGTTTGTSFSLTGDFTNVTYVRVTAVNAGGESLPSITAGAKPQLGRRAPILIVNNFSRFDRTEDEIESHYFGTAARVRPRYNNSFDYVVQAADAIEAYNSHLGIEYTTDTAIANGQINLNNYADVIWMSGEQSSGNGTFTTATQPLVSSFLSNGGKLFVSGSEIGWDLVAQNHGSTFYSASLKSTYVSDDAGTYATAAGIAGTALAGVSALNFDNGTHGTYDVDFPDVLSAPAGSTVAMKYSTGTGAAIQYSSGNTKIINLGFPFESIYTASQRNSLMSAVLNFFGANVSLGVTAPDLLAASDSGFSTTDNYTNRNNSGGKTLQFNVSGSINGATINLYSDGALIGSGTTTGGTVTITTNNAAALLDGTHQITARQVESGFSPSADSTALAIIVDTVAPGLSTSSFAYDAPQQSLNFTFSEDVSNSIAAGDLALHNNTSNTDINSSNFAASGTTSSANFTFPGLSGVLPTGNYTATIAGANILDKAGNALADDAVANFYFQAGDGNHSGTADIQDFNILATNFGKSEQTFSQGNYDYSGDGTVGITDFNILAANFGKSVSTDAPAAPASFQANQGAIGMNAVSVSSTGVTATDDDLVRSVLL